MTFGGSLAPVGNPFNDAHRLSDLDRGPDAQHHSLGKRPNQSAPGNHTHGFTTGDIKHSFAPADGIEWVESGTEVSRFGVTARLFALFGTAYGVGDGSTTFKLPDVADRFLVGTSAGKPVGTSSGADSITLVAANLPPHAHEAAPILVNTTNAAGGSAARLARGTATDSGDTTPLEGSTGNGPGTSTPVNTTPKHLAVRVHFKT